MDLHRLWFKRNQKPNMGSFMTSTYGVDIFPMAPIDVPSGTFDSFAKCFGNKPSKSFSYPNNLTDLKLPPDLINRVMDPRESNNLSGVSLTCILGGFVGVKSDQNVKYFDNPIEVLNEIVSQSITRTMSCPDPFNFSNFIPTKKSPMKESPPVKTENKDEASPIKMSYADVAKLNLSNLSLNKKNTNKPTVITNNSSQKLNGAFCKKKSVNVSIPPPKGVNIYETKLNRFGTNNCKKIEKDCSKPKFQPLTRNSHSRKAHHKRVTSSPKRELGTKRNNQKMDIDGSVWGCDNFETEPSDVGCNQSPISPSPLIRVRSISSESECSSEVSECLRNPRVRSLSECSVNSIDSEDSFIVFDDCADDRDEESEEEDSSSDEDEYDSVVRICSDDPQSYFIDCANSKWNILPDKKESTSPPTDSPSSLSPCPLKKVRFACGKALAKIRKICVWDFAHRAARVGPWEQAARDRDRFSKRVSSLAPLLNPVLDSTHRAKIYDLRFAPK